MLLPFCLHGGVQETNNLDNKSAALFAKAGGEKWKSMSEEEKAHSVQMVGH